MSKQRRRNGVTIPTMALMFALSGGARAEWVQTTAGPWNYYDPANWQDGHINNIFLPVTYAGVSQAITFTNNPTLIAPIGNYHKNGGVTLTLRGQDGDHTLTLGGDYFHPTYVQAGYWSTIVQIGNNTAGQRLHVELGEDRTFQVGANINQPIHYQAGLRLYDEVRGVGCGLTKNGVGRMALYGSNLWNGTLTIRNGEINLGTPRGMLSATHIAIHQGPTMFYNTSVHYAALYLDNGGGGYARNNRVPDATPIALRGGLIALNGGNGVEVNETLGTVVAESGQCRLYATRPESYNVTLTITNFIRSAGATLLAQGHASSYTNLGVGTSSGDNRIVFTRLNGDSPSSAMVNGIIPWAICQDVYGQAQTPFYLAYGDYGLKPFTAYVTDIGSAGPTDNLRMTGGFTLPAGTTTVNSIIFSTNLNSGATLKLTSGSMVFDVIAGVTPGYPGCNLYADVDFNGNEGLLFTEGYLPPLRIHGQLKNTGGNGFTFSAGGTHTSGGARRSLRFDAAQSYTGPTRVIGQGSLVAYIGNAVPATTALYLDESAQFLTYNPPCALGSLEGGGEVSQAHAGAPGITVGGNHGDTEFYGAIVGNTAMTLIKAGSGTLTLSGTNNTFAGWTRIASGALLVDGILAGGGAVTNQPGATLGGSGTIAGPVVAQAGAILAPGNPVGTLTLANGLTLNPNVALNVDLGADSDLLRITGGTFQGIGSGSVTVNVNVANAGGLASQAYTLIDWTGATANGVDAEDFVIGTVPAGFPLRDGDLYIEGNTLRLNVHRARGTVVTVN